MLYLVFKSLLLCYVCVVCIWGTIVSGLKIAEDPHPWYAIPNVVILGLMALISFGFSIFIVVLFFYHIFLIMTNQTTSEYLKKYRQSHPTNPFEK